MSRITGCVGISLGADDTIETSYGTSYGRQHATLRIGLSLGIDVADATPETLRQIAAAAEELAEWVEQQDAKADIAAQVDMEDGVRRPVIIRGGVAA